MMDIGTWSNAMAENIKLTDNSDDEDWGGDGLPSNLSMCPRDKCKLTPISTHFYLFLSPIRSACFPRI